MATASVIPHAPEGRTPDAIAQRMGYGPVRFTVSDALKMVQHQILPEDARIELLDGLLVYRDRFDLGGGGGGQIVPGVKHSFVIKALTQLTFRINNARRHLMTQDTLICSDTHAPICDGTILRGTLDDYRDRLPTAADALCVIEVADSSYERDAGEKLIGYARAGVAQYVIINLRSRTAEIYTTPEAAAGTYPPPQVVAEGQTLSLRIGEDEFYSVELAALLP